MYDDQTDKKSHTNPETPLEPCRPTESMLIALVKGMEFQAVRSWKVSMSGPAPQVVFEISSEETGDKDG